MTRSRTENRLYMRDYRAKQSGSQDESEVTGTGNTVTDRSSVAAAVEAEIEGLNHHGTGRPGLAAAALRLAELLDDPSATPQRPAAAGRLRDLLDELHRAQVQVTGTRLSMLQAQVQARHPA